MGENLGNKAITWLYLSRESVTVYKLSTSRCDRPNQQKAIIISIQGYNSCYLQKL
ncbi:hypothetical protein [Floridanema evergladense]|uniref:Uncharacterized protein n=1 Tax=Floridaenema evergladense BLCC-F167 TaxID=3153639 RepID=A0ABV4WGS0_9CYAN